MSSLKFLGPKYQTKVATREMVYEKCSVQTFIAFETQHFFPINSELAKDIKPQILFPSVQVRVMGSRADSDEISLQ